MPLSTTGAQPVPSALTQAAPSNVPLILVSLVSVLWVLATSVMPMGAYCVHGRAFGFPIPVVVHAHGQDPTAWTPVVDDHAVVLVALVANVLVNSVSVFALLWVMAQVVGLRRRRHVVLALALLVINVVLFMAFRFV